LDLTRPSKPRPARHTSKRATTLNATELAKIKMLYPAGVTTHDLAQKFGMNKHTVQERLRAMNVRTHGSSLTPDEVDRAKHLYASGLSIVAVAAELNLGESGAVRPQARRCVALRGRHGHPRTSGPGAWRPTDLRTMGSARRQAATSSPTNKTRKPRSRWRGLRPALQAKPLGCHRPGYVFTGDGWREGGSLVGRIRVGGRRRVGVRGGGRRPRACSR
jgi:hypothetical protein